MLKTGGMIALVSVSLVAIAAIGVITKSYAETLAEKLGYSTEDKLLIVHADDVGMCHSVNMATVDALEKGMVTCGSIMIPCPGVPEIAEYCRKHPEADLGIHLTLTAEWQDYRWGPVAPRSEVPGLLDPEGFMWHGERDTARHASPAEVEKEVRAQIDKALQLGIKPSHIDSHMGTLFVRPDYFQVYIKLAKEYGIPPLIVEYRPELAQRLGKELANGLRVLAEQMKATGFPVLDYIMPDVGGTFETKREHYEQALRDLKPGVTEMIVHLGYADEELRGITNSAPMRQLDYEFFTAESTKKLIDELGIKLIGWKEFEKLRSPEKK